MKRSDLILLLLVCGVALLFGLVEPLQTAYMKANAAHPYGMAFLKFAILATLGEVIGLRIKTGAYYELGFGVLPRAVVWGLLGMWIAVALKTFAAGTPYFLQSLGVEQAVEAMKGPLSGEKVLCAFLISVMMNTTFGPVFMTLHKVTDTHILNCGGSLRALVTPIPIGKILSGLNWKVQWGFVFKKTIPLFWIPAHTITFLLKPQHQVLFATLLGVALGIFLSVAAIANRKAH